MTTEQQKQLFQTDETKPTRLQQLLADPVLIEAIRIVTLTDSPAKSNPAFLNPTFAAAIFSYQAGIFDAFRNLEALTKPLVAQRVPQPKALEPLS